MGNVLLPLQLTNALMDHTHFSLLLLINNAQNATTCVGLVKSGQINVLAVYLIYTLRVNTMRNCLHVQQTAKADNISLLEVAQAAIKYAKSVMETLQRIVIHVIRISYLDLYSYQTVNV